MTDAYAGYSQFVVGLNNGPRRWFDHKTVLLITTVTLPVIIFSGIYILILSGSIKVLYPKSYDFEVPYLWLHRAKMYSYHSNRSNIISFHTPDILTEVIDFRLVCYYNFPNEGLPMLEPDDVDPFLCTHIIASFASVVNNSLTLSDFHISALKSMVNLKQKNDNLKILVSVGGAGDDKGFPEMVANHLNRKTFIRSIVDYVKHYNIDGVDLDWEFPAQNSGGGSHQRMHFTQLLEELRYHIDKHIKYKFLVSVAVAAPVSIVDISYDVGYMNQFVDFVNLMSYDFHFFTKYTPFTGLNAPVYPTDEDQGLFSMLNINSSAYYWLSKGMDRAKINIGLPTYGHSFRLVNSLNNGLYAPARGYGKLGTNGFVDFNQICKFLDVNQITPVFDTTAKSPYAVKSSEWVSFDNEQSLSFKAEYVRDHQFGGVMVYSLNTDDHTGDCAMDRRVSPQTFPLTKKIREILSRNYSFF